MRPQRPLPPRGPGRPTWPTGPWGCRPRVDKTALVFLTALAYKGCMVLIFLDIFLAARGLFFFVLIQSGFQLTCKLKSDIKVQNELLNEIKNHKLDQK